MWPLGVLEVRRGVLRTKSVLPFDSYTTPAQRPIVLIRASWLRESRDSGNQLWSVSYSIDWAPKKKKSSHRDCTSEGTPWFNLRPCSDIHVSQLSPQIRYGLDEDISPAFFLQTRRSRIPQFCRRKWEENKNTVAWTASLKSFFLSWLCFQFGRENSPADWLSILTTDRSVITPNGGKYNIGSPISAR